MAKGAEANLALLVAQLTQSRLLESLELSFWRFKAKLRTQVIAVVFCSMEYTF